MKKLFVLFGLLIAATMIFAQAPQAFNYQAIARDINGDPLIDQAISVKISVLSGSTSGMAIYSELHDVTTNSMGLFTLQVGNPDETLTGSFNTILWGVGSWFLQVEIDPDGGSDFQMMGTTQLLSVPYSLNSASLTLHSPNGTSYEIAVDDQGNLITNCVPDPSQANAGSDQFDVMGTNTTLEGNIPEFGEGQWSILSGENGSFMDATNPTTIFTGQINEMYALQWQIHTPCDTTYDTVNINFVAPPQLEIGDEYGGGIVAYILQPGDPGYVEGEINGFVAAPTDQSSGTTWGCFGTEISGADGTALGTGYQNTLDIVSGCSTAGIAARICNDLELNGYDDWYLPSKEELNILYLNKSLIGGFNFSVYWSSSESNSTTAIAKYFSNGQGALRSKDTYQDIRAIRSFTYTPFTCGDTFTDTRDGNTYASVQIGEQCWMAENLAYLPEVSPSSQGSKTNPYYYVYGYQGTDVAEAKVNTNYQIYGALYNWPASLEACPEGWILPTDAEWSALMGFVSSQPEYNCNNNSSYIAKALAATTNWSSSTSICDIGNDLLTNNLTGFSALPDGDRNTTGSFGNIGNSGYVWSSTEYSTTNAWIRSLFYYKAYVIRTSADKNYGFSVRCVKN